MPTIRMFHTFVSISLLILNIGLAESSSLGHNRNLKFNNQWKQRGKIESENDLGFAVASNEDGSIVVIGEPTKDNGAGILEVHKYDESKGYMVKLGETINNESWGSVGDFFGWDVAINKDGNVLAVSAPKGLDSGYVAIYRYDAPSNYWEQVGEHIQGLLEGEQFGYSVAMSEMGNMIAVGAPTAPFGPGRVRVYFYDGSNQLNEWKLLGNEIVGENVADQDGHAVDILEVDGEVFVAVGAPLNQNSRGSAAVFKFNRGLNLWDELGNRYVDGDTTGTNLGRSVSLGHDGNKIILAVGFPGPGLDKNSPIKSGAEVYSITFDGVWDYYGQMIAPKEMGDNTGFKVSLSRDGQTLAVSSPDYRQGQGLVRVYQYNKDAEGEPYELVGSEIIGEEMYDEFGYSLALSKDGKVVTIGSPEQSYVASYTVPSSFKVGFIF